jgi:putative flippase GtrA
MNLKAIGGNKLLQLAKYIFVAAVSAMFDYGSFWLLLITGALHYSFAVTGGFLCGTMVNFLLSNAFVFQRKKGLWTTGVRHFLSSSAGLLVNLLVVIALVELEITTPEIAKLMAMTIAFIVNFSLIKWYAFGDRST